MLGSRGAAAELDLIVAAPSRACIALIRPAGIAIRRLRTEVARDPSPEPGSNTAVATAAIAHVTRNRRLLCIFPFLLGCVHFSTRRPKFRPHVGGFAADVCSL